MAVTRISIGIGIAIIVASTAACSRSAATYLARGNDLMKANHIDEAALAYRSAINKDKNYVDAYDKLAQLEDNRGNFAIAYVLTLRANELRPKDEVIQWRLVDEALKVYAYDSRRPKAAYQTIRRLLDQANSRGDHSAKFARAEGLLAFIERRNTEAISFLENAERLSPGQQDVRLHLVQLYIVENRVSDAEKLARISLDANPHFLAMYETLLQYYRAAGQNQDVERLLNRAVSENPTDSNTSLKLAEFYGTRKDTAAEERILRRLIDNPKVFPDGRLQVGEFYANSGRRDDAIRCFEEGERVDSNHKVEYGKRLANLYWAEGKRKEATAKIQNVVALAKEDEEALRIEASFLLEDGKELPRVIHTYAALTKKYPGNHILHYQLGRAYQQSGDLGAAWKAYQEAARLDPTFLAVKLNLAEISAQRGDYGGSLRYLDELRKIDTGNIHVRFLRAATLRILKRIPDAKEEILSALRQAPNDPDCQIERGLIALEENKFDEAQGIFQALYRPDGDLRATRGLVQAYSGQGRYAKARAVLAATVERFPNDQSLRQSLAEVTWIAGDREEALRTYQQILAANPANTNAKLQIARLYIQRGDVEKGLGMLRDAAAAKQPDAALIMATTLHQHGRLEEARAAYQQAMQLDPNNPLIKNNLAYCYAQENQHLDDALRLVNTAIEQDKTNPLFSDTLAFVYLKKNMFDSSQHLLQGLISRYPENPTYRLHLAMTLMGKGDRLGARAQLQTALLSKPTASTESEIKAVMASLADAR